MNLVFHHAALGDFALILPMLRGLEGSTTLVAPWSRGRLASALIDDLTSLDIELFEFTRMFSPEGPHSLSPAVGEAFAHAQRVISFISNGDDNWSRNVIGLAPQVNLACLTTRPPEGYPKHVCDWHEQELLSHGITLGEASVAMGGDPEGPVVIHPGSGGVAKCWPMDRYEALIKQLQHEHKAVRVIFGEAEAERWPQQELERWHTQYHAVGCGSLEQLVEQLMRASAYIGNDAGPTHVAAQLGLPTTALFGPTDPVTWAPRGPSVRVIAPESPRAMDWLDIDTVFDSVTKAEA